MSDPSDFPTDPLGAVLTPAAIAALDAHIARAVANVLRELLPRELERANAFPWMNTYAATRYLGITENALRLRSRQGLVQAHRDGAGRLRFHRDELDHSMRPEPPRRRRR